MTNRERIIKTNPADLLCDMQKRIGYAVRDVCIMHALGEVSRGVTRICPQSCEQCIYDWLGREEEKRHDDHR